MKTCQQVVLTLLPTWVVQGLTPTPPSLSNRPVDVAIVGGGLAGLSAARDLQAAGKIVTVLEAQKEVGGHVKARNLTNGGIVELGAANVGPTMDRVLALMAELDVDTFPEYNKGNTVLLLNGKQSTYDSTIGVPPLDPSASKEVTTMISSLDRMAKQVNVNAPWTSPNAALWDSLTLRSWLANITTTTGAKFFANIATEAIFSAEPSELSLLYALKYIAGGGNVTTPGTVDRHLSAINGAQARRVAGGTSLLPAGLAKKIGSQNILTSAPVRSIVRRGSGDYQISSDNHPAVVAKSVIVAMAPPFAARIHYEPPLPARRDQLTQRFFMGAIGKAVAVYDKPWWRDANLTGQAVSDFGTTRITYDYSPQNASWGALVGFLETDEVRSVDDKTTQDVQDLVKKDFVRYFGPRAANVSEWVVEEWDTEPYARGGPVALAGPGTLTKYGAALTEPVGNIHWAGTETSPYWAGFMDGAIRSGERAAKEVLGTEKRSLK